MNPQAAFASGGLTYNSGGLTSNAPIPNFSVDNSRALNLPQALNSGGLTMNQGVLGASTTKAPAAPASTGGGNNYQNSWQNAGHSGTAPVGYHGENPSGPPNLGVNIDSLYQPIFASYDQTRGQINQNQQQDLSDLLSSYNQNKGLIPGYQQQAQSTVDQSRTALGQQLQSAYDQAGRNYTLAAQNGLNQFGNTNGPVANSPYDAVNALALQEQARSAGQISQQGVQGQQELNTQQIGIQNWVNQQNATLDQQYSQAKDQLNQTFQQQLLALQNDENATTAQKAQGKMQLIEDVMNQNNAIAQQAMNFKQQLALYNAQMGATGGQGIDMSGLLAQMGVLGNNANSAANPANQTYSFLTGQGQNALQPFQATQNNNDQFLQSLLGNTGTAAQLPSGTQIPTSQGIFG